MKHQKNTPERNLHPEVKPVCKNCKWWDINYHSRCDFIAISTGDAEYKKGQDAAIAVRVLDDSGLIVYLKTGPDFGCVNFRPDEQDSGGEQYEN